MALIQGIEGLSLKYASDELRTSLSEDGNTESELNHLPVDGSPLIRMN